MDWPPVLSWWFLSPYLHHTNLSFETRQWDTLVRAWVYCIYTNLCPIIPTTTYSPSHTNTSPACINLHPIDIKCQHLFKVLLLDARRAMHYCSMLDDMVQGSAARRPCWSSRMLVLMLEKSLREMSFLIRITFHQTPNASCFKEETCTPQPLRICHPILRYSYPKHVSQDLKVRVDFQKL